MSEPLYLISVGLILGTIAFIFGLKYVSAAYQAHIQSAGDARYRELAQRAAQAQSDCAASLSALHDDVSQIAARLSAVEKILKDVG